MNKGTLIIDQGSRSRDWVQINAGGYTGVMGFGVSARSLSEKVDSTVKHYYSPVSRSSIEDDFDSFALTWGIDNRHNSNAQLIAQHPSYQRIVGMGRDALPLIFKRMKKAHGHWFLALQAITGINPVKVDNRGDIPAMTNDWLDWGKRNGFNF
jgi:hypothetical protein